MNLQKNPMRHYPYFIDEDTDSINPNVLKQVSGRVRIQAHALWLCGAHAYFYTNLSGQRTVR